MPRRKNPWFRWYVETTRDPKLRRRPGDEQWCWPACLAIAAASPVRGVLLMPDGTAATIDDIADEAGKPVRVTRTAVEYFEREGVDLLSRDAGGTWYVTRWDGRQFESDDVTARTRRYREKEPEPETLERSYLVPEERSKPLSKERSRERSPLCISVVEEKAASIEEDFAELWDVVPKRRGDSRKACLKLYSARRTRDRISKDDLLKAALGYRDDPERRSKPQFTISAATFLGPNERWRPYLDGALGLSYVGDSVGVYDEYGNRIA